MDALSGMCTRLAITEGKMEFWLAFMDGQNERNIIIIIIIIIIKKNSLNLVVMISTRR